MTVLMQLHRTGGNPVESCLVVEFCSVMSRATVVLHGYPFVCDIVQFRAINIETRSNV